MGGGQGARPGQAGGQGQEGVTGLETGAQILVTDVTLVHEVDCVQVRPLHAGRAQQGLLAARAGQEDPG